MTFGVERRATDAIKAKLASLKDVEDQRADTEEALEEAYELLGTASAPIANPALGGVDDDELLEELNQLAEEDERNKLAAQLTQTQPEQAIERAALPSPPREAKAKRWQQDDERELAELEKLAASMNLVVEQPMPMPMAAAPIVDTTCECD